MISVGRCPLRFTFGRLIMKYMGILLVILKLLFALLRVTSI